MASIKMVTEDEATGKVKDIYEDIKSRLGIDFVPNLYKVMASKPEYLEANPATCNPPAPAGVMRRSPRPALPLSQS